jgi:methyl-accepting chemotaxis protein
MKTKILKWKRKSWSIRTKWSAVILVLCIVPMLVFALFFVNYFGGVTKSDNQQTAQTIEDMNISRIDEWMQSKIYPLQQLIKEYPEVRSLDSPKIIPLLYLLNVSDIQVDRYNWVNAKGEGFTDTGTQQNISKREYFKKAMTTKAPVISDMMVSTLTGKYVMTANVPILDASGSAIGLLNAVVSPDTLTNLTQKIKMGNTGFGYIISGSGDYYSYPDPSRIGKKVADFSKSKGVQDAFKTILANTGGSIIYKGDDGKEVMTYYKMIPNTNWKLLITVPTSEMFAKVTQASYIAMLLLVVVVLIVTLVAIILTRLIVKPIVSISTVMKEVADGNLHERLEVRSEDEIGQMSRNINAMIDALAGIVQKLNVTINQVATSSEELLEAAEQSTKSSEQISSAIQEVANGTETQLQGAQQSARAMEEMATGIQRISESSGIVADQTGGVTKEVDEGYVEIQSAIKQMNVISSAANQAASVIEQLYQHSEEIGKIVDVISDISNQT